MGTRTNPAWDFRYLPSGHPSPAFAPGAMAVTILDDDAPMPMLVEIYPGENAALDVAALDIETTVSNTRRRVSAFFCR